jgi:hypothetical protein
MGRKDKNADKQQQLAGLLKGIKKEQAFSDKERKSFYKTFTIPDSPGANRQSRQ